MIADENWDAASELESRLYAYLKIPLPRFPARTAVLGHSGANMDLALERLRQAVSELERSAARIGAIPSAYPKHIDLLMRLISALLPWYTRSLVQFGRQTAHTVRTLSEAVAELACRQRELAALHGSSQTHRVLHSRPRASAVSLSSGQTSEP